MLRGFALAVVYLAYVGPVLAGENTFCLLTNKVAAAGKLREYSDTQIENGLCMTTKEIVSAIAGNNSFKQEVCMQAAEYMMGEFKKRFPSRSANSVAGKC
jgi:hypothetical protein